MKKTNLVSSRTSDSSNPAYTNSNFERGKAPPDNFIICKNVDGTPTATYKDYVWDLNPIRLSAKRIPKLNFNKFLIGELDIYQQHIVGEAKFLLFCLIHYGNVSSRGSLSAKSIQKYFLVLKGIVKYCDSLKQNPLVGKLTLKKFLQTTAYISGFIKHIEGQRWQQKAVINLLQRLNGIGHENIGYSVVTPSKELYIDRALGSRQTPVIPQRIYLNLVNLLCESIDLLYPRALELEAFISEFADKSHGVTIGTQRKQGRLKESFRPTFPEVMLSSSLKNVFVDDYSCNNRGQLSVVLSGIQHILRLTIHTFTGMRDQEVGRLLYSCLAKEQLTEETVDDNGVLRDKATVIDIISSTTKHSGYKKKAAWIATSEVIKAVRIAQAITNGLAKIHSVNPEELYLFTSTGAVRNTELPPNPCSWHPSTKPAILNQLIIESTDLLELALSSPDHPPSEQDGIKVGEAWPLKTHQLRRSLAFYASNSGFVSMPTIAKQFKHLAVLMARYYGNNFEKVKTIFGYFDPKTESFEIPEDHFMYSFQMAVPMHMAYDLLATALGDMPIYGGSSTHIQKQRDAIKAQSISIQDFRSDTIKRVRDGEISWRTTFLGGCMKQGECDSYMLGQITDCLHCDQAVIQIDKLDAGINKSKMELEKYPTGSGERQILDIELNKMTKFLAKHKEGKRE